MINKFMWPSSEGDKWAFLGLDDVGLTLIVSIFSFCFSSWFIFFLFSVNFIFFINFFMVLKAFKRNICKTHIVIKFIINIYTIMVTNINNHINKTISLIFFLNTMQLNQFPYNTFSSTAN